MSKNIENILKISKKIRFFLKICYNLYVDKQILYIKNTNKFGIEYTNYLNLFSLFLLFINT